MRGDNILFFSLQMQFVWGKFNDGLCYVGLGDALNHVPELEKYKPVHHCEHGNIGFGDFAGFERVDENE